VLASTEHFTLPLIEGIKKGFFTQCPITLHEYPHGTGSMVRALENNEVQIAIALTEGLIAAKINENAKYRIVATYVSSPLRWASVAKYDNSKINSLADLYQKNFGISRFGSGSHIMSYILADNQGWDPKQDVNFEIQGGLEQLLHGVETGETDTFMWERYMLRPAVSGQRVKYVGETVTPWPCFMIAVREDFLQENASDVQHILKGIEQSTHEFKLKSEESLKHIEKYCSLNSEDARRWFSTVQFSSDGSISKSMLQNTVQILSKTGVLSDDQFPVEDLVSKELTKLVD